MSFTQNLPKIEYAFSTMEGLKVSMEKIVFGNISLAFLKTGSSLFHSSSGEGHAAPGLVEHAPMSTISAPSRNISSMRLSALSGSMARDTA